MKELLIFAGTTEGRILSERLAEAGMAHTVCVATEYGEVVLKSHPLVKVHQGRMGRDEIREFLRPGNFLAVADATHPYAGQVTRNIKAAMEGTEIPYLRLGREGLHGREGRGRREACRDGSGQVIFFETQEACVKALEHTAGNILLTTGSKELFRYCTSKALRERLYVRVLPSVESLSLCMEQGIRGKQIIAMQGPFTVEMNEAMLRQYHISCLVTKESGAAGGYREKLDAAERAGVQVFVAARPEEEEGLSLEEVYSRLKEIYEKGSEEERGPEGPGRISILLAGIGMGDRGSLTGAVREAADNADILMGAERMLSRFHTDGEKYPYYQAEQILPFFRELQEKLPYGAHRKAVVLFSGDSGFYSGCRSLYRALETEIHAGRLNAGIRILPGISSVAYLAACIGESYQDALILSMHGKALPNLARRIKGSRKTFLLMSGVGDVNRLGKLLSEAGLSHCRVVTGYQMSCGRGGEPTERGREEAAGYGQICPGEQIRSRTPEECCSLKEEGLYTCFVENPSVVPERCTPGMADGAFIRGRVPMTKEEVRAVSICKLRLHRRSVVYDIGSGTGSAAVEIAALSDDIRVIAVEKKQEAVRLIQENIRRFGLENITAAEADAPEGLEGRSIATHALIGGSGGRMKEILDALYRLNPEMRVVVNAVTLETICEIREILSSCNIKGEEVVQIQVSRGKTAGAYHLMQAENPVWICSFDFNGADQKQKERTS